MDRTKLKHGDKRLRTKIQTISNKTQKYINQENTQHELKHRTKNYDERQDSY